MGHDTDVFVKWIMPVYIDRNDWSRGHLSLGEGDIGFRESYNLKSSMHFWSH